MLHSKQLVSFIVLMALFSPGAAIAENHDLNFDDLTAQCYAREEYRIGGAAIGDCYRDHAAEIDADITQRLDAALTRFYPPDETARLLASHQLWLDYRDAYCSFIEDFPGNTQAWVNASACVLTLTHNRLRELDYLGYTKRLPGD